MPFLYCALRLSSIYLKLLHTSIPALILMADTEYALVLSRTRGRSSPAWVLCLLLKDWTLLTKTDSLAGLARDS